ncbi:MAG: hypothetical protein WCE80_04180 [Acidimicrobiia bacterium]
MISITELRARVVDGRVVFDKTGTVVDVPCPPGAGPAVLVVSEMTDALKIVEEGHITGSVDRSQVWLVDAIVLAGEVLDRLGDEVPVEDLIEAVRKAGYEWQISPTSAP